MKRYLKTICINKKVLCKYFISTLSVIYTIISALSIFFEPSDLGLELDTVCKKSIVLIIVNGCAFLIAMVMVCVFRKVTIVKETQLSITVRYGNLWKFGFPKYSKKQRIVVVNVNTAFDTIVDGPEVVKPLVSATSIHGQWILNMAAHNIKSEDLNYKIKESFRQQEILPSSTKNKTRGNSEIYPRGTIAVYPYENTTFYLLAMAEFDDDNNAQNTQEKLRKTILKLIEYIGKFSQNCDVYIPIMGSGISRTGIDDQTALELLLSNLKLNKKSLRGNINIVVYEKDRDKVIIGG